ncbi:hypothetical protein J2T38_001867 [Neisseria perflava]|nr:hypothetical protein [Neisseria perflava]
MNWHAVKNCNSKNLSTEKGRLKYSDGLYFRLSDIFFGGKYKLYLLFTYSHLMYPDMAAIQSFLAFKESPALSTDL